MNYLELNYPKSEYGAHEYPQQLCNYLTKRFFTPGKSLLDIGSGRGNALVAFKRAGLDVKGVDKNNECTIILPDMDVRKCDLDKKDLPFNSKTFDYVYSKSVIEHIYNTQHFVEEIYRVLKFGGVAVQLVPDWRTDQKTFWDDPTHVKPFTRVGFQRAFIFGGFVDVRCERFYQLPFLWKYPNLIFIRHLVSLLPSHFKWKDKEKTIQRILIRHSKECMLLLSAHKKGDAI